ncbi:MAG TPA: DUF4956 domain-containing protein [Longimicrobiaceae bacterium]|nr:DUF4956 domain-containing protein [Longimicrobiaceae bacterium]
MLDRTLTEEERSQPASRFPLAQPPAERTLVQRLWRASFLRLTLYYLVLITVGAWLVDAFPIVRAALVTPVIPAVSEGAALLTGQGPPASWITGDEVIPVPLERALITLLVILGALTLAVPVAWVYMMTKRLRYDPALVRSVIILPIAVAGILLVVKNSLAIAFSLAGIVAAVRFRNTLKDPRDAVYIFLTIAIGISAGVQALDVALVASVLFNIVVILLWKFQVGSIYGGRYGRTGVLSIGDSSLLVGYTPQATRSVRRKLLHEAREMGRTDGILLVHTTQPELSRQTVQDALGQTARRWKLVGIWPRGEEVKTAEYLVRLAKETTAADLIGELDEWSAHIEAAEYIPFRQRARPRESKKKKKSVEKSGE